MDYWDQLIYCDGHPMTRREAALRLTVAGSCDRLVAHFLRAAVPAVMAGVEPTPYVGKRGKRKGQHGLKYPSGKVVWEGEPGYPSGGPDATPAATPTERVPATPALTPALTPGGALPGDGTGEEPRMAPSAIDASAQALRERVWASVQKAEGVAREQLGKVPPPPELPRTGPVQAADADQAMTFAGRLASWGAAAGTAIGSALGTAGTALRSVAGSVGSVVADTASGAAIVGGEALGHLAYGLAAGGNAAAHLFGTAAPAYYMSLILGGESAMRANEQVAESIHKHMVENFGETGANLIHAAGSLTGVALGVAGLTTLGLSLPVAALAPAAASNPVGRFILSAPAILLGGVCSGVGHALGGLFGAGGGERDQDGYGRTLPTAERDRAARRKAGFARGQQVGVARFATDMTNGGRPLPDWATIHREGQRLARRAARRWLTALHATLPPALQQSLAQAA